MKQAVMNWSGGKDSSLALHRVLRSGEYDVRYLVTTVSQRHKRIAQHGVREDLLKIQTKLTGIPLRVLYLPENPTMEAYEKLYTEFWEEMKGKGITAGIFGDIFLEDLRKYREKQLKGTGVEPVFPLWKEDTEKLARDFTKKGFRGVTVCINQKHLSKELAGREMDPQFFRDLPDEVDPCGENGEYHSFVYDGPIFKFPIKFRKGEMVERVYQPTSGEDEEKGHRKMPETRFWFCDLEV